MAYDRISPIGDFRADLRIGMLCSMVSNALGGHAAPADFLIETELAKPDKSPEDISNQLKAFFEAKKKRVKAVAKKRN